MSKKAAKTVAKGETRIATHRQVVSYRRTRKGAFGMRVRMETTNG